MRTWLTLRYEVEEDALRVTLAAAQEYGGLGRSATATLDLPDDDPAVERLAKAAKAALKEHGDRIARRAERAAAQALVAAGDEEDGAE